MGLSETERRRAANLWDPFVRAFPPVAKSSRFDAFPTLDFPMIGGLEEAKEEILTYACAATDPDVYQHWGTIPPSGLLLVGPSGSGKALLAEALASRTGTPFLQILVPRLVVQLVHSEAPAAELLQAWSETLGEMPQVTVLFDELDFAHDLAEGAPRRTLPTGPIEDFLIELVDSTASVTGTLTLGSTSHPDTLAAVYLEPGRFERVVSVNPTFPADVVLALEIHAAAAEDRAERPLFDQVDWPKVVDQNHEASIGNWVRLLHAVLRRKARIEAADEDPSPVSTEDFLQEVDRFKRATTRLPVSVGRYL